MKLLIGAILALGTLISGTAHAAFDVSWPASNPATANADENVVLTLNYSASAAGAISLDIIAPDDVALVGIVTPSGSNLTGTCQIVAAGSVLAGATTPWKTTCTVSGTPANTANGDIKVTARARNGGFANGQPARFDAVTGGTTVSHTVALNTTAALQISPNGNFTGDYGSTVMQVDGVLRAGLLMRYQVGIDETGSGRITAGATASITIPAPFALAATPVMPPSSILALTSIPAVGTSGVIGLSIGQDFGIAGALSALTPFTTGAEPGNRSFQLWLFVPCDGIDLPLVGQLTTVANLAISGQMPNWQTAPTTVAGTSQLAVFSHACNTTRTTKQGPPKMEVGGGPVAWTVSSWAAIKIVPPDATHTTAYATWPDEVVVVDRIPTGTVVFSGASIRPALIDTVPSSQSMLSERFDLYACALPAFAGTFDVATFDGVKASDCWQLPGTIGVANASITHVVARSKPGGWRDTDTTAYPAGFPVTLRPVVIDITGIVSESATGSFTNLACVEGSYEESAGQLGNIATDATTGFPTTNSDPCARFETTITDAVFLGFDVFARKGTTDQTFSEAPPVRLEMSGPACVADAGCASGRYCNGRCAEKVVVRYGFRNDFYSGSGTIGARIYFAGPGGNGRVEIEPPPGFELIPGSFVAATNCANATPAMNTVGWVLTHDDVSRPERIFVRPDVPLRVAVCPSGGPGTFRFEARPKVGALLREDTRYDVSGALHLDNGGAINVYNGSYPPTRTSPVWVFNPGAVDLDLAQAPCTGNTKHVDVQIHNTSGADSLNVIVDIAIPAGMSFLGSDAPSFLDLVANQTVSPAPAYTLEYLESGVWVDNMTNPSDVTALRLTVPLLRAYYDIATQIHLKDAPVPGSLLMGGQLRREGSTAVGDGLTLSDICPATLVIVKGFDRDGDGNADGLPMAGVEFVLATAPTFMSTTTSGSGVATLTGIAPGTYQLTETVASLPVGAGTWAGWQQQVELTSGGTTTLNVLNTCACANACLTCEIDASCTPNTDDCSDDNACTVGDVCANGACAPGTPMVVDDGNPCTDDSCVTTTGVVVNTNDDSNTCGESDACSTDACVAGVCTTTTPECLGEVYWIAVQNGPTAGRIKCWLPTGGGPPDCERIGNLLNVHVP